MPNRPENQQIAPSRPGDLPNHFAPKMTANERRRMRAFLRHRDGDDCFWCPDAMVFPEGRPHMHGNPDLATIEHIVERCDGGSDEPCNLALAHYRCNAERDNRKRRRERAFGIHITPAFAAGER